VTKGNGITSMGLKIGAWSAAVIGVATIMGWLYSFLIMRPVLASVAEERQARVFSDSLLVGRIERIASSQITVAEILGRISKP
jgi:hypothetical protein